MRRMRLSLPRGRLKNSKYSAFSLIVTRPLWPAGVYSNHERAAKQKVIWQSDAVLLHNTVQRDLFFSFVTLRDPETQAGPKLPIRRKVRRRQFRYFARHSLTSFCE
jgi:hypothetical protein